MKPKYLSSSFAMTMVLALPAGADVVYSNLKDIAIPADFGGVYLNVETGESNTNLNAPQTGWDINPFYGGSVLWNSPTFQPVRAGTGATDVVLNLGEGAVVGSGRVFSKFTQGPGGETPGGPGYGISELTHLGNGPEQFEDGNEGYLGFRLNGNYGWMRVVFTNNTSGALIKEWAYDNSGSQIATANIKHNNLTSTVTLDSAFGAFTVSSLSPITDSGGATKLLKTGANSATLAGVNTYTGTTTVSEGRLDVTGSIHADSAVSVGNPATLGGNGTIHGNVTLDGTLRPGEGGGGDRILDIGMLTANPGSSVVFNITGENDHDQLRVGNSFSLAGMALQIDDFSDTSVKELGMGEGDSFLTSDASFYKLIDGDTSGMFSNVTDKMAAWELTYFGLSGDQYTYNVGIQKFWVAPGSTYLVAIPESGTFLLGSLGLLALLRRRRD